MKPDKEIHPLPDVEAVIVVVIVECEESEEWAEVVLPWKLEGDLS